MPFTLRCKVTHCKRKISGGGGTPASVRLHFRPPKHRRLARAKFFYGNSFLRSAAASVKPAPLYDQEKEDAAENPAQ
jgi:hypothetical protein